MYEENVWLQKQQFQVSPTCSESPTEPNHLTNKEYVDDLVSKVIGTVNTDLATLTTVSEVA